MPISTSAMFEFLDRPTVWNIERYEIASPSFALIRRSLRQIILGLRDSDDQLALDVLDALRPLLSEWLTAPVPFDSAIHHALVDIFGQPTVVQNRWGRDIRLAYETAIEAAETLFSDYCWGNEGTRSSRRLQPSRKNGKRSTNRILTNYCNP
jgi:hypothetical protein